MQLVHKGDNSVAIVRKALPEMSRHGIPITPANYAVWFEYLRADNVQLTGEMDEALKHGRITTAVIEDLYRRYIDTGDRAPPGTMRDGLRALIDAFREQLKHATGELSGYNAALETFMGQLTHEVPAGDLARFVGELADQTRYIARHNADLQRGLEQTSENVGALQAQLDGEPEPRFSDAQIKLATRESFSEVLRQAGQRALDDDTHGPCLLLIDIDHFGTVVETCGAAAAARVLDTVAATLQANIREQDTIAHFEGNLFAVLLTDLAVSAAPAVAELLRKAVAAAPIDPGQDLQPLAVTVSIGMAWLRQDESLDDLLERADTVLFLAKEGGRNRVTVDR